MRYRIGTCSIDTDAYEIRSDRSLVAVEPQVFDLLVMLIECRDRVVSKDEIVERVWKGRIVSEATLNSRIRAVRQVLGDDGSAQRIVRTVHGRGYRFVGEVVEAETASPQASESARPASRHPSVVVMPFDNLSGEGDQYFVDGVVEEITSALSRVREFFVIARQSAFAYKARFVDVREIGRQLGVAYVVEGTVRRGGDRLRISVQLVDAETRTQLWSERYEGAVTDIFEFQDRIAAQVAGAIHPAIRNAEIAMAKRKPPASLSAYDLVMRAYPMLWAGNGDANKQAIELLRRAVAIDGKFGRAHALLAWCHAQEVVYDWSANAEVDRASALACVEATVGSIDDDPTALTAAGAALSQCHADQSAAAALIQKALVLDPNNAWAWARYGWVAVFNGHAEAARERFERALRLSPLDPLAFNLTAGMASLHMLEGEWAAATRLFKEIIIKHPEATRIYRGLAACAALAGDLDTARSAACKLKALLPNISVAVVAANHPMRHIPRVIEPFLDGLRRVGIPET
jgi:TolB-like protein/Flp pilus assembly protein TadD